MSTNEQTKLNTITLKQCPLKDGDHKIWMCNKFKQQSAKKRYETLKKLKLRFCCLISHMTWDCKSERLCGVNGCKKKHNRMLNVDFEKSEKDNISEEPMPRKQGRQFFTAFNWKQWIFTIDTHFNRKWKEMCGDYCTLWYWIHSVIYGSRLSFIASVERQRVSHVSSRNTWFVRS